MHVAVRACRIASMRPPLTRKESYCSTSHAPRQPTEHHGYPRGGNPACVAGLPLGLPEAMQPPPYPSPSPVTRHPSPVASCPAESSALDLTLIPPACASPQTSPTPPWCTWSHTRLRRMSQGLCHMSCASPTTTPARCWCLRGEGWKIFWWVSRGIKVYSGSVASFVSEKFECN